VKAQFTDIAWQEYMNTIIPREMDLVMNLLLKLMKVSGIFSYMFLPGKNYQAE